MGKLTKKEIESLSLPETGQTLVWDSELKGFGVRLTPGGISYFVQNRINGRTRRITIGKHGVFTPQVARDEAKELLRSMAKGVDPAVEKKRQKDTQISLRKAADEYVKNKKTRDGHTLKKSTQNDINKHINGTFDQWRDLPVTSITEDMILNLYRESTKKSVAQTNQAFRILRAIFNWTRDKSMVRGSMPENPVNVLKGEWGHVPSRTDKIPTHKFGHAWNFLTELREHPGQTIAGKTGADLCCFLLVTGARFTEGASLLWENVNLDEGYWKLIDPKNRNPVTFPLSSTAKEIIESRPRTSEFVFPGIGKKGYIGDVRTTMRKLSSEINEKLTPHDLRRSFVLAAGQAGIEFVRCKLLMNHKLSGDVTVSHYMETSDLRWLTDDSEKVAQWILRQGHLEKNKVVDINVVRKIV